MGQIAEHLAGIGPDPEDTSVLIERFLIGGNIMDSGATYFGRYANQAVITRAERPDIQLASLMEDTRCLVLTGTGEPIDYIKAEAMQRDVPLIRVERDTLPTVEAWPDSWTKPQSTAPGRSTGSPGCWSGTSTCRRWNRCFRPLPCRSALDATPPMLIK